MSKKLFVHLGKSVISLVVFGFLGGGCQSKKAARVEDADKAVVERSVSAAMRLWIGERPAHCGLASAIKVASASTELALEFPYGEPSNLHVRLDQNELWDKAQWSEGPRFRRGITLPRPGRYPLEIEMDFPAAGVLSQCRGLVVYEPAVDALLEEFKAHYGQSTGGAGSVPVVLWSRLSGRVSSLMLPKALPLPGGTLEEKATAFVARWGALWGLAPESTFVVANSTSESFGKNLVLRQKTDATGLAVIGGDVRLMFNANEDLVEVKGSGFPSIPAPRETGDADLEAAKAAVQAANYPLHAGSTPIAALLFSTSTYALQQGWIMAVGGQRSVFVELDRGEVTLLSQPRAEEVVRLSHVEAGETDAWGWPELRTTQVAEASLDPLSPPSYLNLLPDGAGRYGDSKEQARFAIATALADLKRFGRTLSCDGRYPRFDGALPDQAPPTLEIGVVDTGNGETLGFAGMFSAQTWSIAFNNLDPYTSYFGNDTAQHELMHMVQSCGKEDLYTYWHVAPLLEGLADLGAAVFPPAERVEGDRWSSDFFNRATQRVEPYLNYLNPAGVLLNNVPPVTHLDQYYYTCPPQGEVDCVHANGLVITRAGALMATSYGVDLEKVARLTYDMNLHLGNDDVVSILEYAKAIAIFYKDTSQYGMTTDDVCRIAKAVREVGVTGDPGDRTYCSNEFCRPCDSPDDDDEGDENRDPTDDVEARYYRCWYRLVTRVTPSAGCEEGPVPTASICSNLADDDMSYRYTCRSMNTYCGHIYVWSSDFGGPRIAENSEACDGALTNAFVRHRAPICDQGPEIREFNQYLGNGGCEVVTNWGCSRVADPPLRACMPN